ncbi:unnamed protein product [Musa acuminata subsp. burmannicoides]
MVNYWDFLKWLGTDASTSVITLLDDPADLVRLSAVSWSLRRFVIVNKFCKSLCSRFCPDTLNFPLVTEVSNTSKIAEVGSSSALEWESLEREHRAYALLCHLIVSLEGKRDCIHRAVCASSTDNYPDESIENTLESSDLVDQRPSYWSSGGQYDPGVSESLTYRLTANLCVVREIKIQPFKAFFQPDHPIYSAKFVRFRMDHSRLRQGTDNYEEQQLASDDYDKWTYVSPEFPMEQENVLQSFKLPHPVICVGGMLQIELMGRVQKQAVDGLYYIWCCFFDCPLVAVSISDRRRCLLSMAEESEPTQEADSAGQLLSQARQLVPAALDKARAATGFPGRWKSIISKLERVSPCLSDLSSHPCFAKNELCKELLQSVTKTVAEAIGLAGRCCSAEPLCSGKLRMQSDLDALSGELDLLLDDCELLVKTGVLGDAAAATAMSPTVTKSPTQDGVRELLARLQIGHAEAKHRAVDGLLEAMREDEKSVLAALGRSNICALIRLLSANSMKTRETAATVICLLAESWSCEKLLVSEGVLPPLIRLAESGSLVCREKAVVSLQRLSMAADTARSIVGHGGVPVLIEICQIGDSICQAAAAGTLRNLSAVPDVRQTLADEGIIRVMIDLLNCGMVLGSKEYAAECLQNLTAINDDLRRSVVSEGGPLSLLAYMDGPLPQEPAVCALRNLIGSVAVDGLMSLGVLPRLVHVLKDGSLGARQAAAGIICRISSSSETKKAIGELGCVPLLARMLDAKANTAREVAAQAISGLMSHPQNKRELKKEEKSVANLVRLLDPSPQNTAKKYAVACLLSLSSSKRCKKQMISYGAVGFLKKLCESDIAGAKKLLERLERRKLRGLFIRK